jgi:3',5'-cyclic-AMP phosphodiesterase
MIIAQISDIHIALDTPDARQRINDFERTIADINALDPAPDLIVHTGDIVHNGRLEEYAQAGAVLATARAPVYVMAGNKDDRVNLRTAFTGGGYLTPGTEFIDSVIEKYPVRLIAVDTLNTLSNKGGFCIERTRRLTAMIGVETTKPIAVFAASPAVRGSCGSGPHQLRDIADDGAIAPNTRGIGPCHSGHQRSCSPGYRRPHRQHPGHSHAEHRNDIAQG